MDDGVASLANDVYDALRTLIAKPEFQGVTLEAMVPLMRAGSRRTFPPRTILLEHGRHSDSVYFLLKGRVRVDQTREMNHPRLLAELQPGDFVGEMGSLTGHARSATATTMEEVEALEMSERELHRVLRHDHPFLVALLKLMHHRYQQ